MSLARRTGELIDGILDLHAKAAAHWIVIRKVRCGGNKEEFVDWEMSCWYGDLLV
jgi:hypothetical protein